MSVLDLLGVIAIGLIGSLSVSGLQTTEPGNRINGILSFLHLSTKSFQFQVTVIGILAISFLVGRTILSIYFTRRILFFLSRRGARISSDLISRLLSQPLLIILSRTTQETLFAVTNGVAIIMLQVLATAVVLASDISLLIVLTIGIILIDPLTGCLSVLVFSVIGLALYQFMHVRASILGIESSKMNIKSNEKIIEVFASYRESVVGNRRDFYAREIGKIRYAIADNSAEISFMPYVSKYVIETAVILSTVGIGAVMFLAQNAAQAAATLAIFFAAGTRIAPAVLRVQQASIMIRGSLNQALPTLDLIDMLGDSPVIVNTDDSLDTIHEGFNPEIRVSDISLTYPDNSKPAISNVSLVIPAGATVAIVGPSGAGKSTMIDLILGVLKPDAGSILISDLPPLLAVAKWPGAVSYVPQDVVIVAGSIRENIALGYPPEIARDDSVLNALQIANLVNFTNELSNGLDTYVGERGTRISGGQRQRLGIARAMFTRPQLLVLDEATSSLDAETEESISKAIHSLHGTTTVIMIAHRLSTVRNADIVVYLSKGKILAMGSFDEVRGAVPDFDNQSKLMGL